MGINQEISKLIAERKKEKEIREISEKTEINMKIWESKNKKESFLDKLFRWFR